MSHTLELSLGIHDPALRSVDGDYWAVRSQKLPRRLFEEAYALIVREADCEHPNALAACDYWGGCLGLSPEWLVFYRFYNGGRDLVGRPERALLLVAVASRAEARKFDCANVLDQPPFSDWARRQPLSGSPLNSGEGDPWTVWLPMAAVSGLSSVSAKHDLPGEKIDSLADMWGVASQFSEAERFLIEFQRHNGQSHGRVMLPAVRDPSPPPPWLNTTPNNPPIIPLGDHLRPRPLPNPIRRSEVPPRAIIGMLCSLMIGVLIGWMLRGSLTPLWDSQRAPIFPEPETGPDDRHQKVKLSPTRDPTAPEPILSPAQRFQSAPPRPDEHDNAVRSPDQAPPEENP